MTPLRALALPLAVLTAPAPARPLGPAETARVDHRSGLAPLGGPARFEPARAPRPRGGSVDRDHGVAYASGRRFRVTTDAKPESTGRHERFPVQPAL